MEARQDGAADAALEGTAAGPQDTPVFEIATAPGDLPRSAIQERIARQERQFRHDNAIEPLAPLPGEPARIWATAGVATGLARAVVYYTTSGAAPTPESSAISMTIDRTDWEALPGYLTRWTAEIPAQPAGTVVRYRIAGWRAAEGILLPGQPDSWAQDGQGFWYRYPPEEGITRFAYLVEPPAPPMPAWASDAVIYQIFLDRFHPGTPDGAFTGPSGLTDRHGGTLRGVTASLPYLEALGVTCLWLSPFCRSETYHRYDTTDLYSIDPPLGTPQDLRELIAGAHARGMRVILDFVPSHCSWHHPAFEAAQRDRSATSSSWFTFEHWPDRYRSFLDAVPALPSFNTEDPGARAHIIGSAVQWLRDYGLDGFRLDHAIGPGMDFWTAFRVATRDVDPACFTVGEVTDTADSLRRYRGRLDAVLDFQLAGALRLTFGAGVWGVARLDSFLVAHDRFMADGPGRVSFLDNHDMDRFLHVAGGRTARLKMAALCQFSLAPAPALYYGTEVALRQPRSLEDGGFGGDALARGEMPWDRTRWDEDVLAFYTALIRFRHESAAVRGGIRRTVWLDDSAGTYAYTCDDQASGDLVLLAFNLSEAERTVVLPRWVNGLEPRIATGKVPLVAIAGDTARVTLDPLSGLALAPR